MPDETDAKNLTTSPLETWKRAIECPCTTDAQNG